MKCKWTAGYFISFIFYKVQWFNECSINSNTRERNKCVGLNVKNKKLNIKVKSELYYSHISSSIHIFFPLQTASNPKSELYRSRHSPFYTMLIRRCPHTEVGEEGAPALWSQPPVHCHTKHSGTSQLMSRMPNNLKYCFFGYELSVDINKDQTALHLLIRKETVDTYGYGGSSTAHKKSG